jgi:hypothetical protein
MTRRAPKGGALLKLPSSSLLVLEEVQKDLKGAKSDFERNSLAQLLTRCQGKVSMAAKIIGKYAMMFMSATRTMI